MAQSRHPTLSIRYFLPKNGSRAAVRDKAVVRRDVEMGRKRPKPAFRRRPSAAAQLPQTSHSTIAKYFTGWRSAERTKRTLIYKLNFSLR